MGLRYKDYRAVNNINTAEYSHWLGEALLLRRYQWQQEGVFTEDELSPEIKPVGRKEDTKSNLTFMRISEVCIFTDFPSVWRNSWETLRSSTHLEKRQEPGTGVRTRICDQQASYNVNDQKLRVELLKFFLLKARVAKVDWGSLLGSFSCCKTHRRIILRKKMGRKPAMTMPFPGHFYLICSKLFSMIIFCHSIALGPLSDGSEYGRWVTT